MLLSKLIYICSVIYLRPKDGIAMKSIIEKAMERHENEQKKPELSATDEELMKLVESLKVNITIFGCGGGGSNTITRLVESGISGATLVAANTDAKHLLTVPAPHKILLGKRATKGLGAGGLPEVGEKSAQEAEEEIEKYLEDAQIVFVTAGMGGGTGTGSAPYIARKAKEKGALVMGVVTTPFKAEGTIRMENAKKGLRRLRESVDTAIVIPNDKLLELVPRLPLDAAFKVVDEVLMESIKGITEILTKPGLVNIDYNDLMTIMKNGGVAMIGIGSSDSDYDRVEKAVDEALNSPMLGDVDVSASRGALIRVVGGNDMTIQEAEKAASLIGERINPMARIIWGCAVDPQMEGKISILAVITGVKSDQFLDSTPEPAQETVSDMDFVR